MSHADRALAELLLERSPLGFIVTDSSGRLRRVNPFASTLISIAPDAVGMLPEQALSQASIISALRTGLSDEVEFSLQSGHKSLLIKVVSVAPEGGRLAILQDVTRLQQEERYRSEFVANVSHELRTPATAITGYAETLLEDRDKLDPYVVSMVEVIFRNARRLTALFNDLLHLSRMDARREPLPLSPVHLGSVVAESIDKAYVIAEDKGMTFEVLIPDDMRVLANRDAMGHILGNLVGNAVKYSHPGGIVTVRAQYRRGFVLVEVIDIGFGIAPEYLDRIFERFYRVDKGRARAAGGTGLGLAIVKKLVDLMGAAIEVRSRPGQGSVFRVLLKPADL